MKKGIFLLLIFASLLSGKDLIDNFQKECDEGDDDSCFIVAVSYQKGLAGAMKDSFKAKDIGEKLCSKDHAGACGLLGAIYLLGDGAKQDYKKAYTYNKKGCDLNNGYPCVNLAMMYENGDGVKKNIQTAKEYYGKACDLKYQPGCKGYSRLNTQK